MDKIRYFAMSDYRRSHLLPDHVTCNVPRRPSLGEPGAWNVARGELVEACRATGARPVELRYAESPDSRHPRTTLTVTTSRSTLAGGRSVEFVTTRRSADRPTTEITATLFFCELPMTGEQAHRSRPASNTRTGRRVVARAGAIPNYGITECLRVMSASMWTDR